MNTLLRGNNNAGLAILAGKVKAATESTSTRISKMSPEIIGEVFCKMTLTGNAGVGPTTNMGLNLNLLGLNPKVAMKALLLKYGTELTGINSKKEYKGLVGKMAQELKIMTDGKDVLVRIIKDNEVQGLVNQLKACNIKDEDNVKNFFRDTDDMYRMYQEMIIDAAKKAFKVKIEFEITDFRPLCLQKYTKEFNYDESTFEFNKNTPDIVDKATGRKRTYYADQMHICQEARMEYTKEAVDLVRNLAVQMTEEEELRLLGYKGYGPVADMIELVKYAYGIFTKNYRNAITEYKKANYVEVSADGKDIEDDVLAGHKAAYKSDNARITLLGRQLLDGLTEEEIASIAQLVSKTEGGDSINRKSSNQMAISLFTEEFLSMVRDTTSQIQVMGYKLLINKGLKVGDKVKFVNGASANGSLLDFQDEMAFATGEFDITEFDGTVYATQPLVFNAPKADFTKRIMFVKPKSYKKFETVKAAIKEDAKLAVNEYGEILIDGQTIAEVKFQEGQSDSKGRTMESLLSVKGWVSHVTIIEEKDRAPFLMFELSDIVEMEREVEVEFDDSDLDSTEELVDEALEELEDFDIEVEEDDMLDEILDDLLDEEIEL